MSVQNTIRSFFTVVSDLEKLTSFRLLEMPLNTRIQMLIFSTSARRHSLKNSLKVSDLRKKGFLINTATLMYLLWTICSLSPVKKKHKKSSSIHLMHSTKQISRLLFRVINLHEVSQHSQSGSEVDLNGVCQLISRCQILKLVVRSFSQNR